MYISDFKKYDMLNGPGVRHSVWVSGCKVGCKGCFSPQTHNFKHGKELTKEYKQEIIEAIKCDLKNGKIDGISFLGGNPTDNSKEVLELILDIKKEVGDVDIWLWSGYYIENYLKIDKIAEKLISQINVMVDGPFIEELKDLNLDFRGSKNQRIIKLN